MRILLIESEREIALHIVRSLREEGFGVDWAENIERGLSWAKMNAYDLGIFAAAKPPGAGGFGACQEFRKCGNAFPIIILWPADGVGTKVEALDSGADDFLQKPFFMAELAARVRALLRRGANPPEPVVALGGLVMDTIGHTAARAGKGLALTRKEFSLLEYFMRHPGVTLTRAMILEHVWDADADPFTNTVDVHVRLLRGKVDAGYKRKLIKTVHGYGYKFDAARTPD